MSISMFRRGLLALAISIGIAGGAVAQQPAKVQGFPTPDAAATAFTDAVRGMNEKALSSILGPEWREFVPTTAAQVQARRDNYLKAWDEAHEVKVSGDKASSRSRQGRLDLADPDREGRRGVALRCRCGLARNAAAPDRP